MMMMFRSRSGKSLRALRAAVSLTLVWAVLAVTSACRRPEAPLPPEELTGSSRVDTGGWIDIHLEGTPREMGYQQGWLLASEIDDMLKTLSFFLERSAGRDWAFFREAAGRMFWPRVDAEYQEEIDGIVSGMRARLPRLKWNRNDITALNGWIELAWYYVPYLDDLKAGGQAAGKAPGYCSAFIAVGGYTEDGKIVAGHNNWIDYVIGSRWNIIADRSPARGHRILMDSYPGAIHSGDDFVINGAGLIYTETTMAGFKGFRTDGTPEFVRARRAAQYASSIDDFVRIMTTDNNGAYANDWLIGDIKNNEIAKLELGLKNRKLWRTMDGYFIGSNFPSDEKLIAEETTFDPTDKAQSVLVRKARWEKIMEGYKGYLDVEDAKLAEGDHIDRSTGKITPNGKTLCGHIDEDPGGTPELGWGPFSPAGSVQGKVTSSALAAEMKFWARMGHPCGRDFIAADFLAAHPEFKWLEPCLKDLKAGPWTEFRAR